MKFITALPKENILNKTTIASLDTGQKFIFHPFIESFKHNLQPKVQKEEFGLFSITSYYRNGITDNSYSITIALPAYSTEDARNNYLKVKKLKEFVSPSVKTLQKQTGLVKMKVTPLMDDRVGYITDISEEIDLNLGFANGYPKLIKVSFTFSVDEMYHEIFGRKATSRKTFKRTVAKSKETPNKKKTKDLAKRAKARKAEKVLRGKKQAEKVETIDKRHVSK